MKKISFSILIAIFLVFSFMVLTACSNNGYDGIYYLYKDGAYQKNQWIEISKNKWKDCYGSEGTIVIKDDKVTVNAIIDGETEELFTGTIQDGILLLGDICYCKEGFTPDFGKSPNDTAPTGTTPTDTTPTDTTQTGTTPAGDTAHTEYSVTIYANGGRFSDGSASKTMKVAAGETIDLSDLPLQDGYEIVGLATDRNGRNIFDIDTKITRSIDVYFIWESSATNHDVTFYLNDGTNQSVIKATTDGKVTYVPVRSGYDFYGWYTDENLTNAWNMDSKVTTDDLVLYAQWIEAATIGQLNAPKVTVTDDTFRWEAITGAIGYNVVVVLNNEEKANEQINYGVLYWNFPARLIPEETGIYNFTIKIRALGDGENTTNSNFNTKTLKKNVRVLDELTGLKFDEATGLLSWNAVEKAEQYVVTLNNKVVGAVTGTSFDMSVYDAGDYSVTVEAKKENWQSSSARSSFTKRRILEPTVYVSVQANNTSGYDYYLYWASSFGADTYILTFDNQSFNTNTNSYVLLRTASLWDNNDTLTFSIQAKDSDTNYLNSPSKETYTLQKLGNITVSNSFDGNDGITVTGKAFSRIRYVFDLNYTGSQSFSKAVIADEDFEYPVPTRSGYIFTGWYTTPECEKLHNFYPEISADTTVYAGWYRCSDSMEVLAWSSSPTLIFSYIRANETKEIYFTVYNTQGYNFIYRNGTSTSSYAVTFDVYDMTADAKHFSSPISCTNTTNRTYSGRYTAGHIYRLRITGGSYNTMAYYALMVGSDNISKYPSVSHNPRVQYTLQEGEQDANAVVLAGNTYTLQATQQPGYTWVGWYKGSTKITDEMTCEITATATRTNYVAKWTYYTVSTETNLNGAGTYTNYTDKKVTVGDTVTLTATTNDGYTWLGWYEGETKVSEGTSLSYTLTMSAENKTYTAKWTYYTLTTNTNLSGAGSYTTKNQVKTTAGNSVTLTASTNNGYTWLGWYDGETKVSDGTSLSYTFAMPAENKIYTAKWTYYTLTTDTNLSGAGSYTTKNQVKTTAGTSVTLTASTNNGYTWLGWYDGDEQKSSDLTYSFIMPAENKTFTAKWIKVTIQSESTTKGTVSSLTGKYKAGDEVTITATTKSGYTFIGWFVNDSKVSDDLSYTFPMPSEDKTYVAKWIKVTIQSENTTMGTVSSLIDTYIAGDEVTITATTNNGYTWLGWYEGETKVSNGTNLTYTFYMPTENKTYMAMWMVCPVILEKNIDEAGSVSGVEGKTAVGEQITISALTSNGYTWLGWYEGDIKISEGTSLTYTMSVENKTYMAKWTYYTLTTNTNLSGAGTYTSKNQTKTTVNTTITLTASTKNGYTWLGWYDGETKVSEGTGLSYTLIMPSENKTYTAKWTYYTLTTDTNLSGAGSYTNKNQVKTTAGNSVTLTASTNNGYTWLGWYEGETKVSSGTSLSFTFDMPADNKTYIAMWSNYSITYVLNGGQNGSNPSCFANYAEVITLAEATKNLSSVVTNTVPLTNGNYNITKDTPTYTFLGWYKESTFENKVTTLLYTGSNIVLYAKWSETTTTITTNTEVPYRRNGDYLYFGSYPQTQITDTDITSSLNSAAGALPSDSNSRAWTSYGYYISSSVQNYMWYIDLILNHERYRGVYFTSYRPSRTGESSSTGNSYQDDNGYLISTVYWFKFEPIKWRIISEKSCEALILCELIIDCQEYYASSSNSIFSHNDGTGYANNYALSNIRKWLNDTFYNTAFSELQKEIIQLTSVDNSARSTNPSGNEAYFNKGINNKACDNTNDNIYLLSECEATNIVYGFNTDCTNLDTARRKAITDYAKSQGAYVNNSSNYQGNGYWMLRSPSSDGSTTVYGVNFSGSTNNAIGVSNISYCGVVPALKIRL